MSEKDDITPEERALFRDSVKGTTPLGDHRPTALSDEKSLQKVQNKPAQSAKIKPTPPKITPLEDFPLSDHSPQPVSGEELLEYSGSGISHKDMRRLKTGEFSIEGALDLHGATVDEARLKFLNFLSNAQNRGWRCIRIVHGKGKHRAETPILKNLVNTWLRQLPCIVAFCSAPSRDGGAGAVYVLMKS